MNRKSLSLTAIFKESFSLTKRHFFVVLGLLLGYVVVCLVLETISTTPYGVLNFVLGLISLAISLIFLLGLNRILLDAADGSEPLFSSFAKEAHKAFPFFVQQLVRGCLQLLAALPALVLFFVSFFSVTATELSLSVYDLAQCGEEELAEVLIIAISLLNGSTVLICTLLLALPLYISVRLMYAPFVLIDEPGSGAISSLRRSWQMTKGNVWLLIVLCLILGVLNILGVLVLLVGVLFTLVLSCFVGVVSYRMLKDSDLN